MAKAVKTKMRVSGNVVEFWRYEKPIFLEGNKGGGRRKKGEEESQKADEYRQQNGRRAKDKFMALVRHNFEDGDKFITLTFRDTSEFDIRNVEETNKIFKKFMQRMKYKYGDFKYVSVIEFQDENKRGAVHYHLICKLGYVPYETLATIWGHGYIGINRVEGIDNIGAYLAKYMQKDMGDPRLKGKKNYSPSKNLEEPEIVYGAEAEKMFQEYSKKQQKKEVFRDCYESEHFGLTNYNEFNIKRENAQLRIGKELKERMEADEKIKSFKDQVYKDTVPVNEQVEKFMEDLNNGNVTHDGAILEAIQKRERRFEKRYRGRVSLSSEFLGTQREVANNEAGKSTWETFVQDVENKTAARSEKKKKIAKIKEKYINGLAGLSQS